MVEIWDLITNQFRLVKEEIANILDRFMTLGIINITKREVVNKKNINTKLLIFRLDKISKGINFWTVDNKNKIQREDLLMMEINQPWNGAAPNFIIILIINMILFELKKKNVKVSLSK